MRRADGGDGLRHRYLFSPDIFCKPLPVVPDGGKPFFGFGNAVTEAFVHDQAGRYPAVLQTAVQFIGI